MFEFTTISAIIYEPLLATRRFFRAVGLASSLTSFGSGGGLFERLGNVLDSEAWAFISSD